jgi:hypothetical protein
MCVEFSYLYQISLEGFFLCAYPVNDFLFEIFNLALQGNQLKLMNFIELHKNFVESIYLKLLHYLC